MTFWSQFTPAECLPHNCNCEFVRDALIGQPSSFWTSLFYFFFAFVLYRQVEPKTTTLKLWTLSLVLLGFSSHFSHGSFIEFAMAMDFASIILILSFFFMIKWLNQWISSAWKITFLLLAYQGGLWLVFFSIGKWFKIGICLVIFILTIVELIHSVGKSFFQARELHWALGILFVSFIAFMIDELKIVCDPHSWMQGHSLWHLGSALSLFLYGKWRFRTSPAL